VIVASLIAVALIDRVGVRWAKRVTGSHEFSRATQTRMKFARRAAEALVIAIGLAIALGEFDQLDSLGRAILMSSAITAAVVGFAARQTIANAIAGLMIAVSQPVRIGDLVTVESQTGTVEDIGLVYTWLRTASDARVLVPNERLASAVVRNDTIRSPNVGAEATVWLPIDADTDAALNALDGVGEKARVSAMTAEGIELTLIGAPVHPADRVAREGELRAEALSRLQSAGLR
jgi:small conductance mechanosensitive channel